jgi:snurportin-1
MTSVISSIGDLATLSLYKVKSNSISSLANQNERRRQALARQKEKRDEIVCQLRLTSLLTDQTNDENKPQWPPRARRRHASQASPIGLMLAEWLFTPPDDMPSWFVVPCPRGQRCLVVAQSHRTQVYGKHGHLVRTMFSHLPKQSVLYCIYDVRSSIYHVLDIIMWNGQDYSTQIECQCRFFVLTSLAGDCRLNEQFQILPRVKLDEQTELCSAEDGYLFYHPLGFYEAGYSPLVCWLKPFMTEEILGMRVSSPTDKPDGYTTAQAYMFEEQTHRKEQNRSSARKSHKTNNEEEEDAATELMSVDA